ncbi:hypothetical protein [Acidithiobacillus caldus]|jgi:hypothetical protein|uniref:Uncharacterized protein n=7 Tax=Acidithiobacillus caldus TaxID=33059 RepID=F9ZTN2_ACICS|nr:hypothetical protein [Acidithiobacillus caldus]AEK59379.1 conserved hypothetical protein [Acidithiobacillus caldus SM-1]AIA56423.1 hypothetical protein Acaty_c2579 [Acidithiobacillus caldus ATCC 51756]AUW33753.1 hypothetical protein A5904_13200 [Acidithiobacillus caldus]MBU2730139.1 hypothetical protein [Acidithiobacillus caldus]MBU2734496.1 hypothetical protein [Acidithiobacillus caldus ATCC 51756]
MMKRMAVVLLILLCCAGPVLAAGEGVVLKIRQTNPQDRGEYELTLSKDDKLLVHLKQTTDMPPSSYYLDAHTFPGKYCGKPAQAILVAYASVPSGDPEVGGDYFDAYILNATTWQVMDWSPNGPYQDEGVDKAMEEFRRKFTQGKLPCYDSTDIFKDRNLAIAKPASGQGKR